MIPLSSTLILALLISGSTLATYGPDDPAKPGDKVTLTFTGKSNSEYFFALENPTSHPVYYRGIKSLWFAPIPVDVSFACKNDKTGEGTVGGFPLFDGGKDPPMIEVAPGKAVKLRLESSASGFWLDEHQGEACHMRLRLRQPDSLQRRAENVDSQEFQP
jgi:hypothetical protein